MTLHPILANGNFEIMSHDTRDKNMSRNCLGQFGHARRYGGFMHTSLKQFGRFSRSFLRGHVKFFIFVLES